MFFDSKKPMHDNYEHPIYSGLTTATGANAEVAS